MFPNHYRGLFPGAKRVGELEWRDDRETNVVEIAEMYELPRALKQHSKGYLINHRAYFAQWILGLSDVGGKRKFSLALAHPCRREHHIITENPKSRPKADVVRREQNAFF